MVGIIAKLRTVLTKDAMKTLYYSLAHPHLLYGLPFWGYVNKVSFDKIFRAQKSLIRLISNSTRFSHTEPLFKELNILKLCDLKKLEVTKLIFADKFNKFFNFELRSTVHSYSTRNQNLYNLPYPRSNILKNSLFYDGIKLYNLLSPAIKSANSNSIFKFKLKASMLSNYN